MPAATALAPSRTPEEHAQGSVPGSINIPVKLDDGKGGFVDNPQFLEQARRHLPCDKCMSCACWATGRVGLCPPRADCASFARVLFVAACKCLRLLRG